MKNLNDNFIENAFTKIRADFENRDNEQGLEILDNYEEQWISTGNLSERQIAWLEKQLNGSWRHVEKQPKNDAGPRTNDPRPDREIVQIPPNPRGVEQLIDVLIHEKLAEEGKALVDLARLNRLAQSIDDMRDLLISLR